MDKNKTIYIATAKTRKATQWRIRNVRWAELAKRCMEVTRTKETVAEYFKMTKDEQSLIKDVGGFVGGYLRDGIRRKDHVSFHSVITLDFDFIRGLIEDFWDDLCMLFENVDMFIYTTHKHTAQKPRARIVILLDRNVSPDEYEPLARWVAGKIGIEMIDDTTYDLTRLFYWPSASSDGPFFSRIQRGEPLKVDDILEGEYVDWHNVAEWPRSSREKDLVRKETKKAQDPTEKGGLIGAFCRCYTIEDAIDKFLPDIYTPTSVTGRYSYAKGSTVGGLVCYEGKFAYSNHDTDPAKGLHNAFDLIRIHKFGDRDAGPYDDITKAPSFRAMEEYISDDPEIKKLVLAEGLFSASAKEDFKDVDLSVIDSSWMDNISTKFSKGKDKIPANSIENIVNLLETDPKLRGRFRTNTFSGQDIIVDAPWERSDPTEDIGLKDISNLSGYVEHICGKISKGVLNDALNIVLSRHSFNPVKEYFESVGEWDGKPRLDMILIDYLGAADTPYTRTVSRMQFVAAVARTYRPGIQYDYMLVLYGKQGIGKSAIVRKMGCDSFSIEISNGLAGKDAMENLRIALLAEFAELASLKRSDLEGVKAFITRERDTFREAYGKSSKSYPRHCVFFGTTNRPDFLTDEDNRRFLVVEAGIKKPVASIWEDLPRERDQIWAEAIHYYKEGSPLYLTGAMKEEAARIQKKFTSIMNDDNRGTIMEFLDMPLPPSWESRTMPERRAYFDCNDPTRTAGEVRRDKICAQELKNELLHEKISENGKFTSQYINRLMDTIPGWKRMDTLAEFGPYGKQRGYERIKEAEQTGENPGTNPDKTEQKI